MYDLANSLCGGGSGGGLCCGGSTEQQVKTRFLRGVWGMLWVLSLLVAASLMAAPVSAQVNVDEVQPAKFWRLYFPEGQCNRYCGVREVSMHEGGISSPNVAIGAIANNTFGSWDPPQNAFDQDLDTFWLTPQRSTPQDGVYPITDPADLYVELASPAAVTLVKITGRRTEATYPPEVVWVQSSNDGFAWVTQYTRDLGRTPENLETYLVEWTEAPAIGATEIAAGMTETNARIEETNTRLQELGGTLGQIESRLADQPPMGGDPVIGGLISDVEGLGSDINNYVCGNGMDISAQAGSAIGTIAGLAGMALGPFGGGGQIMILLKQLADGRKMLQQQLEEICLKKETNAALMDPDPIGSFYIDQAMADPATAPLAAQYKGMASTFPVGDDDQVTAANKTNVILLANQEAQMNAFDRMMGGKREVYELERSGVRVDRQVIESGGEPSLSLAENDPEQAYDTATAIGAELEPSYSRYVDLEDTDPEVSSCFAAAEMPTGDGSFEDAMARLRYNSRQRLAGSDTGEFLCSIMEQPERNPTNICFGPENPMAVGGTVVVQSAPVCIYGPKAPDYVNFLMGFMPAVLMLTATVGGVRMFV